MSLRRVQKIAEAIREVVSMAILTELRDPRIHDVTVTFVEAAGDFRSAKIHVSVMGDEVRQNLSLRGLQNAAGFLQAKIAQRLDLRYTPRLTFLLDQGVKRSIEVAKILREVLPPDESAPQPSDDLPPDETSADMSDETSEETSAGEPAPQPPSESPPPDEGPQP
jgi:ribosome-binding factor A